MTRRVFIVWCNRLLYEAVQVLLSHSDIEVVGAKCGPAAWHDLNAFQPDTVIIEDCATTAVMETELLHILESSAWDPRILRLSLQNNQLQLYHREQRTIDQAQQLIDLIQSE